MHSESYIVMILIFNKQKKKKDETGLDEKVLQCSVLKIRIKANSTRLLIKHWTELVKKANFV